MTSSIVKKVLDRLEGEKELKILESNNEIKHGYMLDLIPLFYILLS